MHLKALFSLSISTLDTLPSGQASNTLTNTANVLQIGISEKLGIFLQFTALMIAAIIIAFTYSWPLTLATSSLLLFIVFVYGITIPIVVKRTKEQEHADAKASSIAGEVLIYSNDSGLRCRRQNCKEIRGLDPRVTSKRS